MVLYHFGASHTTVSKQSTNSVYLNKVPNVNNKVTNYIELGQLNVSRVQSEIDGNNELLFRKCPQMRVKHCMKFIENKLITCLGTEGKNHEKVIFCGISFNHQNN